MTKHKETPMRKAAGVGYLQQPGRMGSIRQFASGGKFVHVHGTPVATRAPGPGRGSRL